MDEHLLAERLEEIGRHAQSPPGLVEHILRDAARRQRRHRVVAVAVFGGTTMLCAATALKAASIASAATFFMPALVPQVATTAMFVLGLVGGLAALALRRPIVMLGPSARA